MKKLIVVLTFMTLLAGVACLWAQSADTSEAPMSAFDDTAGSAAGITGVPETPSEEAPADTIYPVTPERRELLNEYSNFSLGWSVFYDIFNWILLLAIAFGGFSSRFLRLAERISSKKFAQLLAYLFFLMFAMALITLPLDIYRSFVVEHKFGFSNQTLGAWFGEWLKGFPIGYIVSAIALAFLYWLLRKQPRRWWLYFSIGAIPFVVLLIVIVPVVVAPLFNDFEPLQDQELKTEILDLAGQAGIHGASVFQVDASKQSKKLNAYVTGLFKTKRIVLYDTIIEAFTRKELLFVMAHEMGHYVMHHVWIGAGMVILLLLLATWLISLVLPALISKYQKRLGFDNLASYASLPLIMLAISVISFFVQPATNAVSRYFERQSDKYGITMTGYDREAAKVAFEKLSAYNLSDPDPSPLVEFWFYDHPALRKRIDFVENYIPKTADRPGE